MGVSIAASMISTKTQILLGARSKSHLLIGFVKTTSTLAFPLLTTNESIFPTRSFFCSSFSHFRSCAEPAFDNANTKTSENAQRSNCTFLTNVMVFFLPLLIDRGRTAFPKMVCLSAVLQVYHRKSCLLLAPLTISLNWRRGGRYDFRFFQDRGLIRYIL